MRKIGKKLLVTGLLVFMAGCASEETLITPPSQSSLGEKNYKDSPALNQDRKPPDGEMQVTTNDTLKFSEALSMALLENPTLESFAWQVRVREAKRIQASLLPNPVLGSEMENFAGTGPFEGYDARETKIRLSQKVLLGADRMKRKKEAAMEKKLAGWDYEAERLNVLTEVTKSYITTLQAQRNVELKENLVEVAQNLYKSVNAQYKAGKVSEVDKVKAEVELSRAKIDLKNAREQLTAAKSKLASLWGSNEPEFQGVTGNLEELQTVPAYEKVVGSIERNPNIARWTTEIRRQEANLSVERAEGIPDLNVSAGFKRAERLNADAAIVGVSIPLPIFDRNQGNIKAAKYKLNQVQTRKEVAVTETYQALQEAYSRLEAAQKEVSRLQESVLPGSKKAFEAARTGYRQGKFDYLQVLDAQRTLFGTRTQYLDALAKYKKAVAEVERLIGTPLSEISTN